MITLNSDRGFVKVESWLEVLELPGFIPELNPKDHELKDIIGRYIFKDYIKCGLSNCHTSHGKGYIVSTKSGSITNIGHQCGKTHFNIEFEQLSRSFEKEIQLHNYRGSIGSFLIFYDQHKETLSSLREGFHGADHLHGIRQAFLRKSSRCPEQVVSLLQKMLKNRSPDLIKLRQATIKEIESLETMQGVGLPRPYYIEEKIGELQGLAFLYEENNLRQLLVLDLEENLKAIANVDIDNGSFKDLKHWAAWCSDFDSKIAKAQRIIKIGIEFCDKSNLEKIKEIILEAEQKRKYKIFIDSIG